MQSSQMRKTEHYYQPGLSYSSSLNADQVICDWETLRSQLLHQWQRLTAEEVDIAGPSRRRIARLVESKYGIAALCVENYLTNFERTMPL